MLHLSGTFTGPIHFGDTVNRLPLLVFIILDDSCSPGMDLLPARRINFLKIKKLK